MKPIGIAYLLNDGAFVKGIQADRPGYFSELYHKYVRFVRLNAYSKCSLGTDPGFLSMLNMLLSKGMGPCRSQFSTAGQLVVLKRSWRYPARRV